MENKQTQPVMLNGLTASETSATASVMGLTCTQPAEVTDGEIDYAVLQTVGFDGIGTQEMNQFDCRKIARAILALRPVQVPMTDELFDLICNAIDKADTITMEGDYMLDSDDCIAVVRVMQALLSVHRGITAQDKKETP